MEESILNSTKKILGIAESYTAFDMDITTHINAAFSILSQLGIGPVYGFQIEDETTKWSDFAIETVDDVDIILVPRNQLNLIKTYIFLKVRLLFDPPTTSFLITAMTEQLEEYEWRLNLFRENEIPLPDPPEVELCPWI